MRSSRAIAFAFACVFGGFAASLSLTGCGGSGSVTPPPNPTVSSVTLSVGSSTLAVGATTQATCTVTMSDGTTNSNCSYASDNPAVATVSATSGAVTAVAAGTANLTATSTQDSNKKSSAVAVTVTAPTVTNIAVNCSPSSITTAQTSVCTATVEGTGNFDSGVSWSVAGGTVSGSGNQITFTPNAAGNATVTATSTASGFTNVSGTANVTVTQAAPTIAKLAGTMIYADGPAALVTTIYGTGFTSSDSIKITSPGSILWATLVSSTEISVSVNLDEQHYSPGWLGFTVCESDGTTCSNIEYFAFIGNQNTLAVGPTGELFQNDQLTGTVRKFTVSSGTATADGSFQIAYAEQAFAVDNKTGDNVGGGATGDADGNFISLTADDGETGELIGQGADNGLSCFTRPSGSPTANLLSCFPVGVQNAPLADQQLGTEPWTVAMGTFSGTTYAFVYSRRDTPTLWKVDASNANPVGSYEPTGFTDSATIQSSSLMGGWEIVVFEQGPAAGTLALISNYDKLLVFVNEATMQETGRVTLTGNPFRIAKDETHGNVIVAYADVADVKTTFAAVNPSTGTVTPLASTSPNLAVGFAVSSDGNSLYVCERQSCDVEPNQ